MPLIATTWIAKIIIYIIITEILPSTQAPICHWLNELANLPLNAYYSQSHPKCTPLVYQLDHLNRVKVMKALQSPINYATARTIMGSVWVLVWQSQLASRMTISPRFCLNLLIQSSVHHTQITRASHCDKWGCLGGAKDLCLLPIFLLLWFKDFPGGAGCREGRLGFSAPGKTGPRKKAK